MTVDEILKQLEALRNEKTRAHNLRYGATEHQYGVKLGDIRALAKRIKPDQDRAMALWATGNLDAQLLAALLIRPASLTAEAVDRLVRTISFVHVADWLCSYVVRQHPDRESLRQRWMAGTETDGWAARAGWDLTAERVSKRRDGLDLPALLDRIESEMAGADPRVQWTMNNTLAGIGIQVPELRSRAIAIGESLGIYRDFPVSKGCTSPFAPIWIQAMVSRQS